MKRRVPSLLLVVAVSAVPATRAFIVDASLFARNCHGATPAALAATKADATDAPISNDAGDITRRCALRSSSLAAAAAALGALPFRPGAAAAASKAKCTDIETCREIGERKVEQDMKENPTTVLQSGVRYKVLQPGTGEATVADDSVVDLIFSISEGGGAYMYSKGFGFNQIDVGGKMQSDLGIDSLRIAVGRRDVPLGIEQALIGMKRGERRRVELPPNVGFETSDWKPEPTTRRGKATITSYKRILTGFGSQPPFPAVTIWDIEVNRIRN